MRPRRTDPDRRRRIIEATLDVIADLGVASTTHRRIAERADVPLGSMTYHFRNMNEVLTEAFTLFAGRESDRFEAVIGQSTSTAGALEAIVALLGEWRAESRRNAVIAYELYTLAARVPSYLSITRGWMLRSRAVLERYFDPMTARQIDAMIEGLALQAALDTEPIDPALASAALQKLAGSLSPADLKPRKVGRR